FGPRILAASQRLAGQLGWQGSISQEARTAFREPLCAPGEYGADFGDGRVEVYRFDTERAEAEHLADLLRRAHLEDGIEWHDMAVLVRSGRSTLPGLRRALGAAGVPVEVAADEVPLIRDPAVQPLLDALRAVLNLDNHDPDNVDHIDAGRAEGLLLGPLAGLDAGDVRRLGRLLRQREKARALGSGDRHRHSRDLLRLAVLEAGFLDGLQGPEVERVAAFNALLTQARAAADDGAEAGAVLWILWSGTSWPSRLQRNAEGTGAASGRAHRDLDSLCALFEAAARVEDQRENTGVRQFLDTLVAQEIPADTLAERGLRGSSVRLLTAHRSKGLEWRLVVIAHVQQQGWPDLRRRSTLLQADRIGSDGVLPPVLTKDLLAEERRLFYVACTRARQRLVVTAVASPEDEGEQPSRFLDELGLDATDVIGRPRRPLSLAGLVAELRRVSTDPTQSTALREAAARRLARLSREELDGRPLVPQADPASWWGTRAASRSGVPVRAPEQPVPISASLLEAVLVCPMNWFLTEEAGGVAAAHQSANVGQLVHALAERVARGELPGDLDTLMKEVDSVWERLEFRTPWSRDREYGRIRAALGRFLSWHASNQRELIGVEQGFATTVDLPAEERVTLRGYADRVELDADGDVVVVDLKTQRNAPSGPAVQRNVQLALYQYAVDSGAVDALAGRPLRSGGAELVQLGSLEDAPNAVVQPQSAPAPDGPEREQLRAVLSTTATMLRTESFPAIAGQHCEGCSFVALCPIKSAGAVTR
ncbi:MAG: PD-(D/E)XK nuclease family protein, partial [Marmoricola sp.]